MFFKPSSDTPLSQGDVFSNCPLIFWECTNSDGQLVRKPKELDAQIVVLTQSCDLANKKSTRIQVAVVHETAFLVENNVLKAKTIRDNVRLFKMFGWYFIQQSDYLNESIVDFRDLHTVSRLLLDEMITQGSRI